MEVSGYYTGQKADFVLWVVSSSVDNVDFPLCGENGLPGAK